jgi:2-amino-4-hydroxy-6-hydroxymethyldihydropteridine diphosphokinase
LSATAKKNSAPHTAYIGLGSNIEPEKNLPEAVRRLSELTEVAAVSSAWRAPAIGQAAPEFLNAAAKVLTDLPASKLKENILRMIEAQLGRVRGPDKFAPRPIDLDILVFNDELLDQDLWRYAHLAVPLAEIYPSYRNGEETLKQAAEQLEAKGGIEKQELILMQRQK